MHQTAYSTPQIQDHGTLTELTAAFDVAFMGSVAKTVTMAAVSPPMGRGMDSPPTIEPAPSVDGGGVEDIRVEKGAPPDVQREGGGVLPDGPSEGGQPPPGEPGATVPVADGGGSGSGTAGSKAGGGLPFTGFPAMLSAAIGTVLMGLGLVARSALRRRA